MRVLADMNSTSGTSAYSLDKDSDGLISYNEFCDKLKNTEGY